MCETLFMGVGRPFTAEQLGQVRAVLQGQLAEAYANSPRSNIVISRRGRMVDARVWALANQAPDPTTHRVLDIGGGTGRNTVALARRGHPVDVVEMTPKFAELIRDDAQRDRSTCA
jgi:protein-L-isoaspartate O-methyltransferase